MIILLTLGLFAFAYRQPLTGPLLWDDDNFIKLNSAVHTLQDFSTYISDPGSLSKIPEYNPSIYRPFRTYLFALEYRLFGTSGTGYHVVSIFMHLFATILLGLVLWVFTSPNLFTASILTALWMLHPVHTETVSFVSSQGDLWVAIWLLLGMLAVVQSPNGKGRELVIAAEYGVFLLFALLSKEIAVVGFLVHLVFLGLTPLDQGVRRLRICSVLFVGALLSAGYALWRFHLLGRLTQIDAQAVSLSHRAFQMLKTFLAYLGVVFWPTTQNALYQEVRWTGAEPWIAAMLLCVIALARFIKPGTQWILVNFGVLWFIFFLIPVCNFVPISIPFAERFVYLPSMGIAIAAIPLVGSALDKPKYRFFALAFWIVIATGLAWTTFSRNRLWVDEVALFKDTVQKSPAFHVPRRNLIQALFEQGRYTETRFEISEYEKRWSLDEDLSAIKMDSLCRLKNWNGCIDSSAPLLRSLRWADRAALWLIDAENSLGRRDRADDLLRQFCRRNPHHPKCP